MQIKKNNRSNESPRLLDHHAIGVLRPAQAPTDVSLFTRRRSDKSCLGVFFLGRRLLFEILLAELGEEGLGFAGTKHQYISIIFNL